MSDIDVCVDIEAQISAELNTIHNIWKAMVLELDQAGLAGVLADKPPPFGSVVVNVDSFDQRSSLCVEWYDTKKTVIGTMVIYDQGTIYSEFDVVQPHPRDNTLFVESVTAWGSRESIATELKSLPNLV